MTSGPDEQAHDARSRPAGIARKLPRSGRSSRSGSAEYSSRQAALSSGCLGEARRVGQQQHLAVRGTVPRLAVLGAAGLAHQMLVRWKSSSGEEPIGDANVQASSATSASSSGAAWISRSRPQQRREPRRARRHSPSSWRRPLLGLHGELWTALPQLVPGPREIEADLHEQQEHDEESADEQQVDRLGDAEEARPPCSGSGEHREHDRDDRGEQPDHRVLLGQEVGAQQQQHDDQHDTERTIDRIC